MSKEYIERGALLKDIEESVVFSARNAPSAEMRGANKIMERIKCAPAADVVEVKHGRWIVEYPTGSEFGRCPTCKTLGNLDWHYCPNCGAKMDGGKDDG